MVFWLVRMAGLQRLRRGVSATEILAAALTACAGLIFLNLATLASFDVVDDIRYQFMYLVLGLAWLFGVQRLFRFVGDGQPLSTSEPTGDPVGAYALALSRAAGPRGTVAFVHATAFSDDRQMMVCVASNSALISLGSRAG